MSFLVGSLQLHHANATTYEQTQTVYADSADGYLYNYSSVYASAWNSSVGTVYNTASSLWIGQGHTTGDGGRYKINRTVLHFDTSFLDDAYTVTSAVIQVYLISNETYSSWNVTAQPANDTSPHKPIVAGDYNKVYYNGDCGSGNTSAWTVGQYNNVTLNSYGIGNLTREGWTYFVLRSNDDVSGTQPSTNQANTLLAGSAEAGSIYSPKLVITYNYEGINVILYGPYYENGDNATVDVRCYLFYSNKAPAIQYLNGTDGNADTVSLGGLLTAVTWNISDLASNKSRAYFLTVGDDFEEIWIYIPDSGEPYNHYTVTITDFLGISNGYLELLKNVGGQTRILERQSLQGNTIAEFYMTFGHSYSIRLICTQGTYTWDGILAEQDAYLDFTVSGLVFATTVSSLNVTVQATRQNTTWISVAYADLNESTNWVNMTFKYLAVRTWTTAYSVNNTGNTQSVNWYDAEATVDYIVDVNASVGEDYYLWSLACALPPSTTTVWSSLDTLFPDCPFPASQLIGFFIVLCVFGIFSYAHTAAGCILGCATAGVLYVIGMLAWTSAAGTSLMLGFVFAFFVAIKEGKKVEREI